MYRGVQMRSRLEARFASLLDWAGLPWAYEPRAYRSSRGEYLPDFQVGERTFVEVKGTLPRGGHAKILDAYATLVEAVGEDVSFWIVEGFGWVTRLGDNNITGFGRLCSKGHLTVGRLSEQCRCGNSSLLLSDVFDSNGPLS